MHFHIFPNIDEELLAFVSPLTISSLVIVY
jgi:hypothetical protein